MILIALNKHWKVGAVEQLAYDDKNFTCIENTLIIKSKIDLKRLGGVEGKDFTIFEH